MDHTLDSLIFQFHSYLFEDGPLDELSLLIEKLLVVVSSRLPAIQNAAAALLHIVLRSGYEASQAYLGTACWFSYVLVHTFTAVYGAVSHWYKSGFDVCRRILNVYMLPCEYVEGVHH